MKLFFVAAVVAGLFANCSSASATSDEAYPYAVLGQNFLALVPDQKTYTDRLPGFAVVEVPGYGLLPVVDHTAPELMYEGQHLNCNYVETKMGGRFLERCRPQIPLVLWTRTSQGGIRWLKGR